MELLLRDHFDPFVPSSHLIRQHLIFVDSKGNSDVFEHWGYHLLEFDFLGAILVLIEEVGDVLSEPLFHLLGYLGVLELGLGLRGFGFRVLFLGLWGFWFAHLEI